MNTTSLHLLEALPDINSDGSLISFALKELSQYERTSSTVYTPSPKRLTKTNCDNCGAPLRSYRCDHCDTEYL